MIAFIKDSIPPQPEINIELCRRLLATRRGGTHVADGWLELQKVTYAPSDSANLSKATINLHIGWRRGLGESNGLQEFYALKKRLQRIFGEDVVKSTGQMGSANGDTYDLGVLHIDMPSGLFNTKLRAELRKQVLPVGTGQGRRF